MTRNYLIILACFTAVDSVIALGLHANGAGGNARGDQLIRFTIHRVSNPQTNHSIDNEMHGLRRPLVSMGVMRVHGIFVYTTVLLFAFKMHVKQTIYIPFLCSPAPFLHTDAGFVCTAGSTWLTLLESSQSTYLAI